jgi:hypothetical protein
MWRIKMEEEFDFFEEYDFQGADAPWPNIEEDEEIDLGQNELLRVLGLSAASLDITSF